jgi:hypothetical protein
MFLSAKAYILIMIFPCLNILGGKLVKSTTVDGTPLGKTPSSINQSISLENSLAILSGFVSEGAPERLALVVSNFT